MKLTVTREEYTAIADGDKWYVRLSLTADPSSSTMEQVRVPAKEELELALKLGKPNILGEVFSFDRSNSFITHERTETRLRLLQTAGKVRPFLSVIRYTAA